MTHRLAALAIVIVSITGGAAAQSEDGLTLQLKWVMQAQFAGYYVAADKGYYDGVGLDVTIRPGGPDIVPTQAIADGTADVIVEWMPAALAARERGVPLVNIAQPFARSGMMLTCSADRGIVSPEDFPGRTMGVGSGGDELPFLNWMSQLGIPTDGSANGVTMLDQGVGVDDLLHGRADCIATMTYNEYWLLIDAGRAPDDLVTFNYSDQGVATLEDGLYVLESALEAPATVDKLTRFVAASMKGWDFALSNPGEAAEIVLANDPTGSSDLQHQRRMLDEVAGLIAGSYGALDPEAYEATVAVLLAGGSDAVISENPGDAAWTHAITDAALN